ncbi:hypothetical protein [Clostridioides sp. ES-S-0190-01]|uniref:hypothetical protein n=1 Tax=Clostridioides sp. ES-S-0190-01 TaxID=2770787 RepID=UPI001D128678
MQIIYVGKSWDFKISICFEVPILLFSRYSNRFVRISTASFLSKNLIRKIVIIKGTRL